MMRALVTIGVALSLMIVMPLPVGAQVIGCPDGKALQGFNVATRQVVCVPVSGNSAELEARVETLEAQVLALQGDNTAQAAEIASLQAKLARVTVFDNGALLISSPNDLFFFSVGDGGVSMASVDGGMISLLASPAPPPGLLVTTATVAGRNVSLTASSSLIATGTELTLGAGNNASLSGLSVEISSSGPLSVSGTPVLLNGSCAPLELYPDMPSSALLGC